MTTTPSGDQGETRQVLRFNVVLAEGSDLMVRVKAIADRIGKTQAELVSEFVEAGVLHYEFQELQEIAAHFGITPDILTDEAARAAGKRFVEKNYPI